MSMSYEPLFVIIRVSLDRFGFTDFMIDVLRVDEVKR